VIWEVRLDRRFTKVAFTGPDELVQKPGTNVVRGGLRLKITPDVHERFVQEFGINMLNTLTSKENRETAHKRRIFVFDERGGVFGGQGDTLMEFQNLTTGVFHSSRRRVVGVRYRCKPTDLKIPEIGAFHTHPALFSTSVKQVRNRIERMLWLSDMDVKAFLKQHELYGYEWHFIGTLDIGCFHIDDVKKDIREPREILRYGDVEGVIERLAPQIRFYDQILANARQGSRPPSPELITQLVRNFTQRNDELELILAEHAKPDLAQLADKVASQCQLLGYSQRQIGGLFKKMFPTTDEPVVDFQQQVKKAYDRLSVLSS
jgi:hypothetical protein